MKGREGRLSRFDPFGVSEAFHKLCIGFLVATVVAGIGFAVTLRQSEPPMRPAPQPSTPPPVEAPGPTSAAPASGLLPLPTADRVDLAAISAGDPVPRVFAPSLPDRLAVLTDPAERRDVFLATLLPHVLAVNEEVLRERRRLWVLRFLMESGVRPEPEERLWLAAAADRYRVAAHDLDGLTARVDAVPPSLLLATAAVASDWGRSEPARSRAALFGEAAAPKAGDRAARTAANGHDGVREAVRAHLHHLNTLPAYEELRRVRQQARRAGVPLEGLQLARVLPSRPPAGAPGTAAVVAVIERFGTDRWDSAQLVPAAE